MSKEKKCAIGCFCTLIIIVVLVGTGAAGWFLALSELLIDIVCVTLNLLQDQLENANVELHRLIDEVIAETGIVNPSNDTSWLTNPRFYNHQLVTLNKEQEKNFLIEHEDAFITIEQYKRMNETQNGLFGTLADDPPDPKPDCNTELIRRKRSASFSRICPGYVSGTTQLVAFSGGGYGQMAQLSDRVQWAFHEECRNRHCSPYGCSCRKVGRTQSAWVYVIDANTRQLDGTPVEKSVIIYSCAAVV